MNEDTVSYYDELSSGYDSLYGQEQRDKLSTISKVLRPTEKQSILDIGCGTGISIDFFDCKFFGIEPSKKMLNIAKKKYPKKEVNLKHGGGENILEKFKDQKFDFIICVSSAHHIKNIEKLFRDIKYVSKGNTRFCFSLLKNSIKNKEIICEIEKDFKITKQILSEKDLIVFFKQ